MRSDAAPRADRRRRGCRCRRRRQPLTSTPQPTPTQRRLPSAASVLRRGLVLWGLGHISIGDRRGWLLLALQPIALATLALVAAQLINGTRWLVVFPPLAALVVAWLAQALHAHRRAVELGARPGGELQAGLFLPFAVAALTTFWLVGGRHGSPTATLEAYVLAWMSGRTDVASSLYVTPPPEGLTSTWPAQSAYLTDRIGNLSLQFGPGSGLDPAQPFDSLRFTEPVSAGTRRQAVDVEIVRRQRVETTILGIVPTAGQETVVVERVGTITLALVQQPQFAWLPIGRLESLAWRIESVSIGTP